MSTDNPTIMDVVAAEQGTTTEADPVLGVLDIIVRHQQAEQDMVQGWMDSWLTEANTARLLMEHQIRFALNSCEWGGTTRDYERTLGIVEGALYADRFHPAWNFYEDQVKEANGLRPSHPKTWPDFQIDRGF